MRRNPLTAAIAFAALAIAAPLNAQSYAGAGEESAEDSDEETPRLRRSQINPYLEASQIFSWQFSPTDDTVTYTQLAAGVDATIAGRNNGATVSLRYERNFAWGEGRSDSDTITGIARGYASIVPRVLTIEAGAIASRTQVSGNGASVITPIIDDDFTTKTYAAYAGPTFQSTAGDVAVSANYRIGYARVDGPDLVTGAGAAIDVFDDSVTHSANVRAGTRPGQPLPVGVGVGAGYFQEDIANLDQRVRDAYVRGDVTVSISSGLALVAGAGIEDVEVSSRDALRDAAGNPVIGPDGRFVTDPNSPRRIAYDAEGLIWDVGVIWRPSRRTALEAHFGHRYDSETFYGSFSWQPDSRSNLGIGVYDGISGFGGRLTNALSILPPDFEIIRDPVTGEIIGCTSPVGQANCLGALLGSVRSAVFRGRGVAASYSRRVGRMTAAIGAGYDRRNFIAAPGTVLAAANGIVDESYYVSGNVSGPIGARGSFTVNSYANWFDSGVAATGDVFALGSSASYSQALYRNLSGRAAVAINMLDSELAPDDVRTATALVGLRYDF